MSDADSRETAVHEQRARAFAERFGDRFRYVLEDKAWAAQRREDPCWARRRTNFAEEAALNLLRDEWPGQATGYHRDELLRLARHDPALEAHVEDFDRVPWALVAANGVVDLRSGELRPHEAGLMASLSTPIPYDPGARSALFERFLEQVFLADTELIARMRRFLGYAATGETREQMLDLWTGTGGNGKGALARLAEAALGGYARPGHPSLLRDSRGINQPLLAELPGVRLVTLSESEVRLGAETIKRLTGGDRLAVAQKYGLPFTFTPVFKLALMCNRAPELSVSDGGLRRRLRVVPFGASFVEEPSGPHEFALDRTLEERLHAEALPAVLAWIVEGAIEWYAEDLGSCAAVERATAGYWRDANPLSGFAEDCLDGCDEIERPQELYREWAGEGAKLIGAKPFSEAMQELGWEKHKSGGRRFWRRVGHPRRADSNLPYSVSSSTSNQIEEEKNTTSRKGSEVPVLPVPKAAPGPAAEALRELPLGADRLVRDLAAKGQTDPEAEPPHKLRQPCSTCGRAHIGIGPECRACRQAATVRGSREQHERASAPSGLGLGDPGYPMLLERAFRAGHITEAELRERLALNTFAYRASA